MTNCIKKLQAIIALALVCCVALTNPMVCLADTSQIVGGDETSQDMVANSYGFASTEEYLDALADGLLNIQGGGSIPIASPSDRPHLATPTEAIGVLPEGYDALWVSSDIETGKKIKDNKPDSMTRLSIGVRNNEGVKDDVKLESPIQLYVENPEGIDPQKLVVIKDVPNKPSERVASTTKNGITTFNVTTLGLYFILEWEGDFPWEEPSGDPYQLVLMEGYSEHSVRKDYDLGYQIRINQAALPNRVVWSVSDSNKIKVFTDNPGAAEASITREKQGENADHCWIMVRGISEGVATLSATIYCGQQGQETSQTFEQGITVQGEIDRSGGFYRSGRALNISLEGWDDSFKELLPQGITEPFTVYYDNDSKVTTAICNVVGKDLWSKIFNNANTSDGLQIEMYADQPDAEEVTKFYCRPLGDSCFVEESWITEEGVLNEVRNADPQWIMEGEYNRLTDPDNLSRYTVASKLAQEGNNITIGLHNMSQEMIVYTWHYTDGQFYNFGDEQNRQIAESYDVQIFLRDEKDKYTFGVSSRIDDSWITTDSTAGLVKSTDYTDGKMTYYIDKDVAESRLKESTLSPLSTKVKLPDDATDIKVDSESCVNTTVDIQTDLTQKYMGGHILNTNIREEHWIEYQSGGQNYCKYLAIGVGFVGSGNPFSVGGFEPVPADRIIIDPSMRDASKGYMVYKKSDSGKETVLDDGEIATQWTGGQVNLEGMNPIVSVAQPDAPDGYELLMCKYEPSTGRAIYNYSADEVEHKKVLLGYRGPSEIEEGKVANVFEFVPYGVPIGNDQWIYSINALDVPDEATMILLDWVFVKEGAEDVHKYEYVYAFSSSSASTEDDHTQRYLSADKHNGPKATISSISGDKYSLQVRNYPTSGTKEGGGFDVYELKATNAKGHEVIEDGDTVTVKFDYPEGYTKAQAEQEGLVLTHFNADFDVIERISGSRITYCDTYMTVDLTSFSPFRLEWGSNGIDKVAVPPEVDTEISDPNPKQREILLDMMNNKAVVETDSSLPGAVKQDELLAAKSINPSEVIDTEVGMVINVKDITGEGTDALKLSLEIHPQMTVNKNHFVTERIDPIEDSYLNGNDINFRIPIPQSVSLKYAVTQHQKTSGSNETFKSRIQCTGKNKYVEITITSFSNFEITFTNSDGGNSKSSSSSGAGGSVSSKATYSKYWFKGSDGYWYIKNSKGELIKCVWLCDDAVLANGINVWYLLGKDGKMIINGLVQDATGNLYSLETNHNGYYGSLRFRNGVYNSNGQNVYLEFEQSHNGSFGAIKNKDGIEMLKKIYGVTTFEIDNSDCVYSSKF